MRNILSYRRQFIIAREHLDELGHWQYRKLGNVYVYTHPDLEVTEHVNHDLNIILLGYMFDYERPENTNKDIISNIARNINTYRDFIIAIKPYAGRFALIYRDDYNFKILHDPLAQREIYYCTQQNKIICGSQPNFIVELSEPKLGITSDNDIINYYKNDMKAVRFGRAWVGHETYYNNVRHLMPGNALDLELLKPEVYWPNRRLDNIDLDKAVNLSCKYLQGVMRAVTQRYDAMMAVTAGIDSRSLLAASRHVHNKIYYFINKRPPLNDNSADIRIPRSILSSLNIPFHVHSVPEYVDSKFKEIFLKNTFMSTDILLPVIYNVYYKQHQNKLNILGVGEIGRGLYGRPPRELTGYYLANKLKYKNCPYVVKQCDEWLQNNKTIAEEYNVDIMTLFLIWGLSANWGAVGNSESDIAIEEFNPYNSYYMYELMLSVAWEHRAIPNKRGIPEYYERMFKVMWKELLDYPFNPPDTLKEKIKNSLERMGLLQYLKLGRYKYDLWKYRTKQKQ